MLRLLCHSAALTELAPWRQLHRMQLVHAVAAFLEKKLPYVVGFSPKTLFLRNRSNFLFIFLADVDIKKRKRKEPYKLMYFHVALITGLNRVVEVLWVGYSVLRPNHVWT